MSVDLGEIAYLEFIRLGVKITKTEETTENFTIYITVPKTSYHKFANGEMMAGMALARRVKEVLTEMGIKRLVLKAKVREDDWTEQNSNDSYIEARKQLYGSQW